MGGTARGPHLDLHVWRRSAQRWSAASRPTPTFTPSRPQILYGVRKRIADADVKVLDVVDGFLQQSGDMAVVEAVDDVAPAAVAGHQANVAQQSKLVGNGGLFHFDCRRQFCYGAR